MYLVLISTFTIKAPGYTMHDRKWFSPLFSSEEPPFVGATTVSTQCLYVWILQQEFACQRNVLEIYVQIFFMMQTATFLSTRRHSPRNLAIKILRKAGNHGNLIGCCPRLCLVLGKIIVCHLNFLFCFNEKFR